jgi:hypoxanthine phosphoribosyltransferase
MQTIKLWDKYFIPFISESEILARIQRIGEQITRDYKDKQLVLVSVLNGSFMFTSDLAKQIKTPLEIAFIRYASYADTHSTGIVKELIGFEANNINGKDIIIIEDIVDTGLTMKKIMESLEKYQPNSVKIASLLLKPSALKCDITIDYLGFEIENRFVVGYGMDYNNLGRNLKELYVLKNDFH